MDSTNFQHHEQQQHLQEHFVGCSPLNNPNTGYEVSSSLDWNPSILPTTRTSANTFCNKLYENEFLASGESRTENSTFSNAISSTPSNDARNASYQSSNNFPKIEEDMLSSFPSFVGLITNPTINSMENPCWFNDFSSGVQSTRGLMQFPLDHKDHHQSPYTNIHMNNHWISSEGLPSTTILNQLGLVSSPNNSTTSVSSTSSPRLGLNLRAMDFLANNACFGSHITGEEVISPVGKIMRNKTSALMNGVVGTKRAAGNCSSHDQQKSTTSNNSSTSTTKKSPLKVSCPPFKVRKEKLGDRIAALHQMVSPFGKTDTASVLTEAIGYIQFLQDQIQTLCMPHAKPSRNKPCSPFQMGPGTADDGKDEESIEDLRKRGLCLVPASWTSYITPSQLDASNASYF